MKKKVFTLIFIMSVISKAYSQIGINTPNPQGVFNVDGAKDNPLTGIPLAPQQLNDFTVTASGNVGIGTVVPTKKLEINDPSSNSAIKIIDGTQGAGKILTSDSSGNANWQNPSVYRISGTLGNPGIDVLFDNSGTKYTGSYIILPPGKWEINVTMLMGFNSNCILTESDWLWVRTTFSDSPSSTTATADKVGNNVFISGLFQGPKTNTSLYKYDFVRGSIIINNTSGINKTYYYVVNNIYKEYTSGTGKCTSFYQFGGTNYGEDTITAFPIN